MSCFEGTFVAASPHAELVYKLHLPSFDVLSALFKPRVLTRAAAKKEHGGSDQGRTQTAATLNPLSGQHLMARWLELLARLELLEPG